MRFNPSNDNLDEHEINSLVDRFMNEHTDPTNDTGSTGTIDTRPASQKYDVNAVQHKQKKALNRLMDTVMEYLAKNYMELEKCKGAARKIMTARAELTDDNVLSKQEMQKFEEMYSEFKQQ